MQQLINEAWLHSAVSLLVRLVEAAAAIVIFAGAALGFGLFVFGTFRGKRSGALQRIRLIMGRFLALGLEFQLGSDLLRTAVAPSWDQIGKLAAVAAIRTGLNFFLTREIREEQAHPTELERADGEREEERPGRAPHRASRESPQPPTHHDA